MPVLLSVPIQIMTHESMTTDSIHPGHWMQADRAAFYGKGRYTSIREFSRWYGSARLRKRLRQMSVQHPNRDLYQFGVYTGGTMRDLCHVVPSWRRMWGFDSFRGLPPEKSGLGQYDATWNAGGWSSADALGIYTVSGVMHTVHQKINCSRTTLVPGFFNESLPALDVSAFQPALLVDIDVDLYVSSLAALEWLFASGLAVRGMLLRYDDWLRGWESDPIKQQWGELRAHAEITRRFELRWRNISHNEYELMHIGAPTRANLLRALV